MNRDLTIPSKLFILFYGLCIGIFLSKEFIKDSLLKINNNDKIGNYTFKVAAVSNKLRWILFVFIGPFILATIIYLIINGLL